MTNYIGPVPITNVNAYSREGNKVTIRGSYSSEAELQVLRELCRKAPNNVALETLLGDVEIAYDPTADSSLTHYCQFDNTTRWNGWYAILGYSEDAVNSALYWGFTLTLFRIGTDSDLIRGLEILRAGTLTNDWSM